MKKIFTLSALCVKRTITFWTNLVYKIVTEIAFLSENDNTRSIRKFTEK